MRILFLTPDLRDYSGAFYQWDIYSKLRETHDVEPYGPGFEGYDRADTAHDVLDKATIEPDVLCLGHGWLSDKPGGVVRRNRNLSVDDIDIPTVLILNKEYRNFQRKIQYAIDNEVDLVFTHHHRAREWENEYDLSFVFWPFAVNSDRFRDFGESKEYDLTFSGLLRNPDPTVPQTDLRIDIQDRLFFTVGQVRLLRRPSYWGLDIFWRAQATSRYQDRLNKYLHSEKRLPEEEYRKLLNRSRISLNTLSPVNLVGTRYFETMASKSLAFCQETPIYAEHELFTPGEHCVTFEADLSDFDEKLSYYLTEHEERERIAENGHRHVMNNHTWEHRINQFTDEVRRRLL